MTETLQPSAGEVLAASSDGLGDTSIAVAEHRLPSIRQQPNGDRSAPVIEALINDLRAAKKMIEAWQFEAWDRMLLLHTPSSDPGSWKNDIIECTYCNEPWPCHEMSTERAYLEKNTAQRGLLPQYEQMRTQVAQLSALPNPKDIEDLLGAHPASDTDRALVEHLQAALRATVTASAQELDRLRVHGERVATARVVARLEQARRTHLLAASERDNDGDPVGAQNLRRHAEALSEAIATAGGGAS